MVPPHCTGKHLWSILHCPGEHFAMISSVAYMRSHERILDMVTHFPDPFGDRL